MHLPYFRHLKTVIVCAVLALSGPLMAQPITSTPGEILLGLQKLNTTGTVLYIAAHPDDENTRLLAWLANERKLRTGYLSLTRGDGGQNLIGSEQGEALGLLRTQELLAARRVDGAEQFFTRAYDFGFSKNPEETFRFWNKDSVLADIVLVIRQFRPDVIITRFPTTGEGGHGHHTASAILALEAFEAAADPKRFPEQLSTLSTWQAKRIFWNTFNFGGNNTTAPDQLKIDVGGYNPLLGKSYGEIAAESRSMHKSQGFGSARQRGPSIEYFKLLKGEPAATDVFEGINTSWNRIKEAKGIPDLLANIIRTFRPDNPSASVASLFSLRRKMAALQEHDAASAYWKRVKLAELDKLILACAGLFVEAVSPAPATSMDARTTITVQTLNRGSIKDMLQWKYAIVDGSGQPLQLVSRFDGRRLEPNTLFNDTLNFNYRELTGGAVPGRKSDVVFNSPYWLRKPHAGGTFIVADQSLIGKAENDPPHVEFHLSADSGFKEDIKISRPIVYKTTDPVKGEIYRPFQVLPPATANFSDGAFVFEPGKSRTISILIQSQTDSVAGKLDLYAPAGWNVHIPKPDFNLKGRGMEASIQATITPSANVIAGTIKAVLTVNQRMYGQSIRRIEYDHIPAQFFLPDAEAKLVPLNLKKAGTTVGYIPGAGDGIPAALRQVGYTVTELDEAALAGTDLSKFDAIVTGVRAYNTADWLQTHYEKLMSYVRDGGNLVVQYNTNNRIGPVKARIAPDSFTITRNRVTDEDAEVRFLTPTHPALNFPNKITQDDFKAWIQERGIYFATDWGPKYQAILSMNDPGEKPNEGSLIIEPYGKGNFVYTGLAFFRQLPAGNPGAYRLFVNLLSLPKNGG